MLKLQLELKCYNIIKRGVYCTDQEDNMYKVRNGRVSLGEEQVIIFEYEITRSIERYIEEHHFQECISQLDESQAQSFILQHISAYRTANSLFNHQHITPAQLLKEYCPTYISVDISDVTREIYTM